MSLGGNHEAAQAIRDLLIDKYGYEAKDIKMLADGSNWYLPPTRENIINEMRGLVSDAQDGDRFVFFFSGHGDQMEARNDPHELDNMDEFIIPLDHRDRTHIILDDEIKKILVLPIQFKNVNLVGIFDCCHSGTIMDLHENIYNKDNWHIDSPTEVESPVSTSPVHPMPFDFRGRKPVIYSIQTPSRRDPLALGQNYAITGDIDDHWDKDKADKEIRGVVRSNSHQNLYIRPFANNRKSSLPLNISVDRKSRRNEIYSTRGSGNMYEAIQVPSRNATNSRNIGEVQRPYAANVTSWSACADNEQNWENARGEAMGTPMIAYLYDNPDPTYDDLLSELALIMRRNGKERQKAWKEAGLKEIVVFQRPQLGSLRELDLNTRVVI